MTIELRNKPRFDDVQTVVETLREAVEPPFDAALDYDQWTAGEEPETFPFGL